MTVVARETDGPGPGRGGRPLAEHVHERLRDLVVEGDLAPGTTLVQEQIAERLGVSRTPVREALGRLVHEGVVQRVAGGGYLVRDLADQQITEVYQVRQNLESMALRLACGRHTPLVLARLTTLVEETAATDRSCSAEHFELNRRFHRALVEPCANSLLVTMIDQLWDHPINRRITRSYLLADPENVERMVVEHRALVVAAADGDEERLLALYDAHVRDGYGDLLSGDLSGDRPAGRESA